MPSTMSARWPVRCRMLLLPAVLAALVTGCGTRAPPAVLLHLPLHPLPGPAAPAGVPSVQLLLPVQLPDYLDRDTLLLPQGATLVPVEGHRWAEPLREAVPRLLRADLSALLGAGVLWSAPLPPGVVPQRQWRVEVLALEANAARTAVRLRARWTWADASGRTAPRAYEAEVEAPAAAAEPTALALAHRQAVQALARRMVEMVAP
jgi:uncharacterized protein